MTQTAATTTPNEDQILADWCTRIAHGHRTYEDRELAMYPTTADRDRALVEWTLRCLGNTGYSAAANTEQIVAILARRHNLTA